MRLLPDQQMELRRALQNYKIWGKNQSIKTVKDGGLVKN